jgi:hypothetical protein
VAFKLATTTLFSQLYTRKFFRVSTAAALSAICISARCGMREKQEVNENGAIATALPSIYRYRAVPTPLLLLPTTVAAATR